MDKWIIHIITYLIYCFLIHWDNHSPFLKVYILIYVDIIYYIKYIAVNTLYGSITTYNINATSILTKGPSTIYRLSKNVEHLRCIRNWEYTGRLNKCISLLAVLTNHFRQWELVQKIQRFLFTPRPQQMVFHPSAIERGI